MPETDAEARARAQKDAREGKAATTQAGEFIREEMHHIRQGKHGARSPQQAIAIGLSKARRSGVNLPPPDPDKVSEKTRASAERAYEQGQGTKRRARPSAKRSRAITRALQKEGHSAASHNALSQHAREVAGGKTSGQRSAAARKASRTKGTAVRSAAARKAARTRAAVE